PRWSRSTAICPPPWPPCPTRTGAERGEGEASGGASEREPSSVESCSPLACVSPLHRAKRERRNASEWSLSPTARVLPLSPARADAYFSFFFSLGAGWYAFPVAAHSTPRIMRTAKPALLFIASASWPSELW